MSIEPPFFSIVVPTYNRLPLLKRTVESLFKIEYPSFEIIVVSDGSTDGTHEYVSSLSETGKIVFLQQQNQGPAMARNLGIDHAKGDCIAFTDDDCIVPADWLTKFSERFAQSGASGIGGSSRTGDSSNIFAVANDLIVNFFKEALNFRPGMATPFLTSNNAAYTKSSLEKIGGFHEDFKRGAEERDLNFRLACAGEKLIYDPEIVIDHYNDADFSAFVKHQFEQGRGSYVLYRNARRQPGSKHDSIPASVYIRLMLRPFSVYPPGRALALSALMVLTQIIITFGFLAQAVSGKKDRS